MTPPTSALVVAGAARTVPAHHRDAGVVIAADSGLATLLAAGIAVHHVVGDLDSVDPADLDAAIAGGAVLHRHRADKDKTDLDLAICLAVDLGVERVVVVAGLGGRADHALAGALLLASPAFAAVQVEADLDGASVVVVRPGRPAQLSGAPGAYVSLLAVGGPALGVRTDAMRYPLDGEALEPGSTRGVSNELLGGVASVSLDAGCLLVICPSPDLPSVTSLPGAGS